MNEKYIKNISKIYIDIFAYIHICIYAYINKYLVIVKNDIHIFN